jgi:hypothetical protein
VDELVQRRPVGPIEDVNLLVDLEPDHVSALGLPPTGLVHDVLHALIGNDVAGDLSEMYPERTLYARNEDVLLVTGTIENLWLAHRIRISLSIAA